MYRTPKLLSASGKHICYLIKKKAIFAHACTACPCMCLFVFVCTCVCTHILYRLYIYIFKCSCSTNILHICLWYLLLHRYQCNSYSTKCYSVVSWVYFAFFCFYFNVCPWIGVILWNFYLLVLKDGQNDLGLIFFQTCYSSTGLH